MRFDGNFCSSANSKTRPAFWTFRLTLSECASISDVPDPEFGFERESSRSIQHFDTQQLHVPSKIGS